MASRNKDELGDRMKADYENRTRYLLPRRSYTILRLDGKSFHQYTKGCARPYDLELMADMDATAQALCEQIGGARLAYVQSDEISLLLTDFDNPQTEAWFDNNLQKMVSISASIATSTFNFRRLTRLVNRDSQSGLEGENARIASFLTGFSEIKPANFDSRVFQIPDPLEVYHYFLWRQQDASRNSILMTAQAHFSHSELQGKSSNAMQDMLMLQKQINWNDQPVGFKRGRCILRQSVTRDVDYRDKRSGEEKHVAGVERHEWTTVEPPIFSQNRDWLLDLIPRYERQ